MPETEIKPQPDQSLPAGVAAENKNGKTLLDRPWLLWLGTIVVAVLLYWGLGYLALGLTHESTDDAFIDGHIVAIAPQVAGPIEQVFVHDNQSVHKGDPLVAIDASEYEAHVAQKRANIRTSEANLKAVMALLDLMAAKVATAEAVARQGHAQADASRAVFENARTNLVRDELLVKTGAISKQDYDAALALAKQSEATVQADEQNAVADDSKVTEAKATWTATQAGVDLARAQIAQAQADIHTSELDLGYTKIVAPQDGRVTRKAVEPGSYVETGQALMAIVPREIWVVANFKETQLTEMRPGQPVEIAIEALGGKSFRGHVDSLQSGSGSRFSLLPAENAVGNFVKVVQRVPVKIVFDAPPDGELLVGPGMSVLPQVQVKSYTIPRFVVLLVALVVALAGMAVFKLVLARVNQKLRG